MESHSDSESDLKHRRKKNLRTTFKVKEKIYPVDTLTNILKKLRQPDRSQKRLLSAVSTNNLEQVELLLGSQVSPNSADVQARSALHLAVSRGYYEIVDLLLQHGADANRKDILGNTPLHLAACTSNLQIITSLINGGANMESMDMYGRNPLQLATSKLHLLRHNWRTGAIESMQLKSQLEKIIDIMISLWKRKEFDRLNCANITDLEFLKLTINSEPEETVDNQMSKLLTELEQFSIK